MAVAAWPMLTQLDIYANPLTIQNKGDPPLLKQYLVDRLGIRMRRQRPISAGKPVIQVTRTQSRKVAEVARPLPKVPLQLRLEASPHKPAVLPPKDEAPSQQMRPTSQPLPPISPSVDIRPKTDPGQRLGGYEDLLISEMPAPGETAREKEELAENNNVEEPLFLTQVDDHEEEREFHEFPSTTSPDPPPRKKEKAERVDSAKYSLQVPDKFKGYEVFWDAPDDPEVIVQTDIQSNLRSLKLAIQHKPVYRSEVDLDRLQKPFEPHQKAKFQPRPPHKTKAEKLEEVLDQIKNRVTVSEENLGRILEDKKKIKEEYPEVPALLKEIQMKYKAVRAESMMEKRQLVEVKDELSKTVGELQSSIHTPNAN